MSDQRTPPNMDLDSGPDWGDDSKPQGEAPAEGMRQMPTDPPAVVPTISSEQMVVAAGTGLSGFAKQNPEGGLTGDAEDDGRWVREPDTSDGAFPAEGSDR